MAFAWKAVVALVTAVSVTVPTLAVAEPNPAINGSREPAYRYDQYRQRPVAPPPGYTVQHRPHVGPAPVYRDPDWNRPAPRRYDGYRGGYGRGYDRGYHRGYDRDDGDAGAAVAAGIIGLAIGAMAAGASRGGGSSHVRWCMNRYRSYDPDTDTYIGRDGRAHRCR